MPIYTVTCQPKGGSPPEQLFIEAISAGQAVAHATHLGKIVDTVAITPRNQIEGEAVMLAHDDGAPEACVCPACGYDLEGLTLKGGAIRCPECGRESAIVLLGRKAAIIRSTDTDVSHFHHENASPNPGAAAAWISVIMAVLGLFHIGPALLAVGLAVYALERSGRRRGLVGLLVGILAVLVRIGVSV